MTSKVLKLSSAGTVVAHFVGSKMTSCVSPFRKIRRYGAAIGESFADE